MTTCFGKSCSFGIQCVSFVDVLSVSVCSSFPFDFEGGMWDLIVLIPNHCICSYFAL